MELLARAEVCRSSTREALQGSIGTAQAAVALPTQTRSRSSRPKQRADPVIHPIDSRPIDIGADEIVAVDKLRNEMLRLPDFLRHHRRLGVGRFLAIDDCSDDGTREFLLDQPDVHVFEIHEPFAESRGGARWTSAVLDQFAPGRWALTIAADELFAHPGCETFDLRWLRSYLDSTCADCLTAEMVDMYPRCSAAKRFRYYVKHRRRGLPTNYLTGGARARLFYDEPMPQKIAVYDAFVRLLKLCRVSTLRGAARSGSVIRAPILEAGSTIRRTISSVAGRCALADLPGRDATTALRRFHLMTNATSSQQYQVRR
jgi:hypothetical protein